MTRDIYQAVWVSNSSINDYLSCPRLYFLRNVYKDPITRHKVNIINPSLALGQSVHEVLEALSVLPAEERFKQPLLEQYEKVWEKVHGKLGGFANDEQEEHIKNRGRKMLERVIQNPGPLLNKAIKIKKELPYFFLSPEENIILCGKIDWLEYMPETDSVHIIDFKTGKNDESASSLQLPAYTLLVDQCQTKQTTKASYWYLDRDNEPIEITLPTLDKAHELILNAARKVKEARENNAFVCPKNGCFHCKPFEAIVTNNAEFVGTSGYNQDLYIL